MSISDNTSTSSTENLLLELAKNGNISMEDVRILYLKMEKEKILSSYNFPTKTSTDGYYHIWISAPDKKGGRKQLKAKTLDELKDKVYGHEKGINGQASKTFKDAFNIVIDQKLQYVKNPSKRLSVQNTILRTKSEYKRFFAGTDFECKYLNDITKKDIETITLYNLNRYNLAKKGFLSFRGILKSVFQLAYNEYWIADNTYDRIDFKKFNDMLYQPVSIDQRSHSDEEINAILEEIHKKQAKAPDYIPSYALELQLTMGLRRGEVPPLRWTDITDKYITISREQLTIKKSSFSSKERFEIVDHTKTYKNRRYPLTTAVKDILSRLKAVHEEYGIESPYLFPAASETGVITNNTVYDYYRRICKRLNIAISKDCIKGTHSFRRNAITKVVNNSGGNILLASKLFGNTPDVAENNYYTGLDMDEALKILNM